MARQYGTKVQSGEAGTGDDGVVCIGSETGTDYLKTRHRQTTQVPAGANRFPFRRTLEPPLRVAVSRRK